MDVYSNKYPGRAFYVAIANDKLFGPWIFLVTTFHLIDGKKRVLRSGKKIGNNSMRATTDRQFIIGLSSLIGTRLAYLEQDLRYTFL